VKSLYDSLSTDTSPSFELPAPPIQVDYASLSAKDFADTVLNSLEFRHYIVAGLKIGNLPSAILTRLMDYAWGKPPERVEHTGKDGKPIETVTEVRRVVVHAKDHPLSDVEVSAVRH
jgi:hypothetical protein